MRSNGGRTLPLWHRRRLLQRLLLHTAAYAALTRPSRHDRPRPKAGDYPGPASHPATGSCPILIGIQDHEKPV